MAKKKSGENMYGEKIVGPKGHVRHAGTTHKRNNASNISHPTGMQAYSGARRNKLKKELDAREDKVRPRKKKVPKAIPTIKARSGPTKRRPTREEQLKDSGVSIDYNQLDNMKHGGKVINKRSGGSMKKGLDKASKSLKNRESKVERSTLGELGKKYMEMGVMPAVKKALEKKFMTPKPKKKRYLMVAKGGGKVKGYKKGGPITYRMSGGQVVGHGYD